MKSIKLYALLFVSIAFLAISCSKENSGAVGATGAAGPAGPAGATGATGPAGPDSVIYSNWITLAMTYDSANVAYTQVINAPALTKPFLDSGFILSYIKRVNLAGDTVISEPSVLGFAETYQVGSIGLFSYTIDYSGSFYRFVLVPGSIATVGNSAGQIYTKQQLQKMTYEQVQKILASSVSSKSSSPK